MTRSSWKFIGWFGLLLLAAGFLLVAYDFSQTLVEVAREQPASASRFGLFPGAIMLFGLVLISAAIVAMIAKRLVRKS